MFAAIAVLAVAVRVAAAAIIPDQSQILVDALAFRDSAAALMQSGHIRDSFQMPLYPLLIAIAGPGIEQLAADILLSALLTWLVGALSFEIFADRLAAIFAALAIACYPPLIFMAIVGTSETLFIVLVILSFLFWYRGSFTPAAVFAVLAILTRPVFDVFAPVLVAVFAVMVHRLTPVQTLKRLLGYAVIYCVLMAPWWVSNYHAYGEFVRLTAGGGTALYAGNNPLNTTGGGNLGEDYDLSGFVHITHPVERDRPLTKAATDYIVQNPKRFFELAWLKFTRIWRPWPVNASYSSLPIILATAGSFLPVLLLGAAVIVLKRRMLRRLSPVYLFAIGYTAVHMIIVGTIRYRLPLEPFLIVFAAVAVSAAWRRLASAPPNVSVTH